MLNMLILSSNIFCLSHFFMLPSLRFKRSVFRFNSSNFINFSFTTLLLDLPNLYDLSFNQVFFKVEQIKVQELTFLSEYFLVTALFCLTLFALFSFDFVLQSKKNFFFTRFWYDNQIIFLLIFILICYLILVYQQINISFLMLTSFNDTILNDSLALASKLIIGVFSVLYLLFINKFLKDQKLNTFEYCVIIFTSIFGFFLLCCVNDFITAYLAIELQGLAFYVLASFKKSSNFSVESGVKYFVLGSLSTALFLFGITLIYGLSGSIVFTDFKDFFIWVFSLNSIFLSSELFSHLLELFQEKTSLHEGRYLKMLIDMLVIGCSEFNQNLQDVLQLNSAKDLNDFLIENILTDVANELQNEQLDYPNFLKYKDYLAQSGYYENISSNQTLNTDILAEFLELLDAEITNFFEKAVLKLAQSLDYSSFANLSDIDSLHESMDLKILINVLIIACAEFNLNLHDVLHLNSAKALNEFLNENILTNIANDLQIEHPNFLKYKDNLDQTSYYENISSNQPVNKEQLVVFLELLDSEISTFFEKSVLKLAHNSDYISFATLSDVDAIIQTCNYNNFVLNSIEQVPMGLSSVFDSSIVVVGLLITILALFFKLALAPFHLWAPDVYEGSPSSSTFFFMVLSKFGIFVLLFRLCYFSFYSFITYWQLYSIIVASISIFVGAVAGLKQRKLKSLLTYSSINNMGFVLLAFSIGSFEGIQIKFFYLLIYMLASVSIWSIILNLQIKKKNYSEKQNRDLGDLALLHESNSVIAQNLGITLFSLAGLPPMIGFLAKMSVFKALSSVSIFYFSVINILFSVIATFYYLRLTKIIFFENILVGKLYETISSKKVFIINFLSFLLVFLFFSPTFLYFYSYKLTLFLNKSFF
jgi:NADH:ubiquinone oxidoreductase subunit 2 (subunit N)